MKQLNGMMRLFFDARWIELNSYNPNILKNPEMLEHHINDHNIVVI